jgi:hypothetical protein
MSAFERNFCARQAAGLRRGMSRMQQRTARARNARRFYRFRVSIPRSAEATPWTPLLVVSLMVS